jgi:hypothetical protein
VIGVLSGDSLLGSRRGMVLVGPAATGFTNIAGTWRSARLSALAGVLFGTLFGASLWLSMIGLTIGTAAMISSLPVFWGMPTAVVGGAAAAAGIALINSLGNVAGFFAPSWSAG